MTEVERPDVAPSRSLVLRTSAALGLGLALAAIVLVLLFRPYLQTAFEGQSGELLRDQAQRANRAARADAEFAESTVRTRTKHALDASAATVDDLPLELVTDDAEAVRAMARDELATVGIETDQALDVMADLIRLRAEQRIADDEERVTTRNRERAETFGRSMAMRAGALLLALVAALFLLHGGLLYRTVLAPVRRLAGATRAVAEGRLGTRIPVEGDDEVARLAASFNAMTESLERAHDDLETLNAGLEERVRTKTAALSAALEESRDANRRLERAMEELRAKERELRQAEKMASLGTLAGGVAHEFNNLLGGILGCAEDAAREDDVGELRDTLSMIERTARRGTAITANLLRFARPGTGEAGALDAAEIMRDVAQLVEPEAVRFGIQIDVETSGSGELVAEPSGLHQVLLNLATNAIHAMRERGGTLTLAVEGTGDTVTLRVSDTGHGISEADRTRLFEPFFSTRGVEGTGLGLSVTYGIVRAHGGRIDIASEPGMGATFRVVLPRTRQPDGGGER
jgi:signal transduction histidine kinase